MLYPECAFALGFDITFFTAGNSSFFTECYHLYEDTHQQGAPPLVGAIQTFR